MDLTTYYSLKKPILGELANINILNDNMDILDLLIHNSLANGAITNAQLAGSIALSKLAVTVNQAYPYVQVTNSAGTVIVGADTTKIPFATEVSDVGGYWSTDHFTAPITAVYLITGALTLAPYQQTKDKYHVNIYVNGSMLKCIGTAFDSDVSNVFGFSFSGLVALSAGSAMDIRLLRGAAGNQALYTNAQYNHMIIIRV